MTSDPPRHPPSGGSLASLPAAVLAVPPLLLLLHLLPQPGYGFHRDELFYLAMGDHLSLFGMGFPPLIALLAQLARHLPLPLLLAVRLLPALAAAALPVVAALLARELGGTRRAQVLAAVAVAVAPLFLRAGSLFQPVVFEQLWWSLALFALAALLSRREPRWWLLLGAALGLAALTKFSVAFLGVGVLVAIVASPLRRDLVTRWPWLAALLALLLALPGILGQVHYGWPFLAQMTALKARQLGHFSPGDFVAGQFLMLGAGMLLWVIGLAGLLLAPSLRPWRALGLLALTVFVLLLVGGGKDYYFGPVHPLLVAAAAVLIGAWLERGRRTLAFAGLVGWLLLGGAALLPIGVPLLRYEAMARYSAALGLTRATRTNYGTTLPLPQDFADMTGWREQVEVVSRVFHALPPEEQAAAAILGNNYGRTAAVALYGREFGLPYPVSRHGDFFFWGAGGKSGEVTIVVGGSAEEWQEWFGEVTEAARSTNRWGVDEEQDVPIFVCRRPKVSLEEYLRLRGPYWG